MNEKLTMSIAEAAAELGVCENTDQPGRSSGLGSDPAAEQHGGKIMQIESIIQIAVLRFPVTVQKGENESTVIPVILTKEQLQAAQIVGQSSKELIHRICNRKGLTVLDIGKAERKTLEVNLNEMWCAE